MLLRGEEGAAKKGMWVWEHGGSRQGDMGVLGHRAGRMQGHGDTGDRVEGMWGTKGCGKTGQGGCRHMGDLGLRGKGDMGTQDREGKGNTGYGEYRGLGTQGRVAEGTWRHKGHA